MVFIKQFEGHDVRVTVQKGKVLFKLIDVAYAVGYSKASSLRYHTKHKNREIETDDGIFLKVTTLNKIAKEAHKTPKFKSFASWAQGVASRMLQAESKVSNTPLAKAQILPQLINISNVAGLLNMTVKEFSDWLVAEGYAGRYKSNNAIFFSKWFKDQGYGDYPVFSSSPGAPKRVSRVPMITTSGLEYVKARLESQRSTNVLSFAKKDAYVLRKEEQERLEKELDNLIKGKFKSYETGQKYKTLLGLQAEYKICEDGLIAKVKEIIAEVKLKELQK